MVAKKKTVTSPALKTYLAAKKHESVLIGDVARHLQRKPNTRDQSVIHPSEMAKSDWCHRDTWHRLAGHSLSAAEPANSLRSELIFAEGHAIHEKWQTWFTEMQALFGQWKCQLCSRQEIGWSRSISTYCDDGRMHKWTYEEVPVRHLACNVRGHADGVVEDDKEGLVHLIEVKSIGPGTLRRLDLVEDDGEVSPFSKITRPYRDHVVQARIYAKLFNEMKMYTDIVGELDDVIIIYENKADQQVREFLVKPDDRTVKPLLEAAKDIMWAVSRHREVACNIGGKDLCPQCRRYEAE